MKKRLLHPDLRRGEADAGGLVHRLVHRVDEPHELAVDVLDLARRCFSTGSPKRRTGMRSPRVPEGTGRLLQPDSRSDPAGIDVDAQATVLAGGREVDLGERVAERVGGFRLARSARDDVPTATGPEHA